VDPKAPLNHSRRVAIGGETFGVRSDAQPEVIDQVARYVDERLERARQAMGETDRFRAAVLASLQVAGELWEARKELDAAKERERAMEDRLSGLLDRLKED
jgi:cell division protein ZapA (FtsZ GTPase activity inhibitor)